ncbi:hypothetical protein [Chryseobacterium bernardetii]|uniref:hypothetical protein n=1 Tax=Chryseobacterium bernardetii TaxID=1241978 RepID=UPI00162631EA|nr:hypothetical protein [Chryseobacterium bernardetii]
MSRLNTINKAYKNAISEGKTKSEAKAIKKQAENSYWENRISREYRNELPKNSNSQKEYDFDSDLNGNGTNWHTSEDL